MWVIARPGTDIVQNSQNYTAEHVASSTVLQFFGGGLPKLCAPPDIVALSNFGTNSGEGTEKIDKELVDERWRQCLPQWRDMGIYRNMFTIIGGVVKNLGRGFRGEKKNWQWVPYRVLKKKCTSGDSPFIVTAPVSLRTPLWTAQHPTCRRVACGAGLLYGVSPSQCLSFVD